jgi:hypothetical protein
LFWRNRNDFENRPRRRRRLVARRLVARDGGLERLVALVLRQHGLDVAHELHLAPLAALERLLVVAQVGSVCGPHLDQARAALGHDVGDAEAAANLHQLSPGNDDRGPFRHSSQGQQHGAGAVVHRHSRLGTGHLGDQGIEVRLS